MYNICELEDNNINIPKEKRREKVMLNSKKTVAIIAILLFVIGIFTISVKASDPIINFDDLMNQTTTNEADIINTLPTDVINDTDTNATTNTTMFDDDKNSILQPEPNTESGNELPQTGVTEDITVMFFIVVCVILAIYAYKKIRDYKA